MEMAELHMQMKSLGAGLGSRGSRMEQPPSLPHCLLHGRPCLVNFKASAAFGKGDVRGLYLPIFICFLVSLEESEKVCLDTHCQGFPSGFPPWHMPACEVILHISLLAQCQAPLWWLRLNRE